MKVLHTLPDLPGVLVLSFGFFNWVFSLSGIISLWKLEVLVTLWVSLEQTEQGLSLRRL